MLHVDGTSELGLSYSYGRACLLCCCTQMAFSYTVAVPAAGPVGPPGAVQPAADGSSIVGSGQDGTSRQSVATRSSDRGGPLSCVLQRRVRVATRQVGKPFLFIIQTHQVNGRLFYISSLPMVHLPPHTMLERRKRGWMGNKLFPLF